MANLKELRNRIRSVTTTKQMTSAMKMVAAAKLGRAQKNIERLRPYAHKLKEIMGNIAGNSSETLDSPYAVSRNPENILLVVVTSNRGLCGAFNTNVCKEGLATAQNEFSEQHAAGKVSVLAVGKKGYEFFEREGFPLVGENHNVYAELTFDTVDAVASKVMDGFEDGTWDQVKLIYNKFVNVMSQDRTSEQFLPLAGNPAEEAEGSQANADYIFEPGREEILTDLIPKSLRTQFYSVILESNAGEQGARMVAMDNATENAGDLLDSLRLAYNQARQAAITTEILEIVSGAEALASA